MAGTSLKGRRGHTPQYRRPRDIFGTVRWPKGGGGERGCQSWAMSEGLQSPVSHSFSTVPPHGGFQVAGGGPGQAERGPRAESVIPRLASGHRTSRAGREV